MSEKVLTDFIINAHKCIYTSHQDPKHRLKREIPRCEGHIEYEFREGNLVYSSSFAGKSMTSGRDIVFVKNNPIWNMHYSGRYNSNSADETLVKRISSFLVKALLSEDTLPLRGPKIFTEGDFSYTFNYEGNLIKFIGKEIIMYKSDLVFSQDVMGSIIK